MIELGEIVYIFVRLGGLYVMGFIMVVIDEDIIIINVIY